MKAGETGQFAVIQKAADEYLSSGKPPVIKADALDDQGLTYRKAELTRFEFKIGLNPQQSEERPWEYVLLRHAPVARDTFAFYGENLLPNFDTVPTWKYTTPHNIQRITSQNQECNNCHGQAELFLTADDVLPDELEANSAVIVTEIPAGQ